MAVIAAGEVVGAVEVMEEVVEVAAAEEVMAVAVVVVEVAEERIRCCS